MPHRLDLLLVGLAACSDVEPVGGPSPVVAPSDDVFEAVNSRARSIDATGSEVISIDISACDFQRIHVWLPLGSAWFLVHPSGQYCEMWIGGETESPTYDGSPAQYCLFAKHGTLHITSADGGPIILQNMAWCVLL